MSIHYELSILKITSILAKTYKNSNCIFYAQFKHTYKNIYPIDNHCNFYVDFIVELFVCAKQGSCGKKW